MTGLVRSTVSPSSSSISRSTPWVDGMLRAHVDDHGLVVGPLDVDVRRVDGHALGEPEHGAHLAAQLAGIGLRAPDQLLGALGGLGHRPCRLVAGVGGRGSRPRCRGGSSTVSGRASGRPRRPRRCRSPSRRSSRARGFLELDRHPADPVVLAERVALPVLGHEDAGHVRVTGEHDAEQVVGLPLHGLDPGVAGRRGCGPSASDSGTCTRTRTRRAWLRESRLTTTSNRSAPTPSGSRRPGWVR